MYMNLWSLISFLRQSTFICHCYLQILIENRNVYFLFPIKLDKLYGISWKYILTRETFLFSHRSRRSWYTIEIDKHDSMMEVISTRRYEARTHPGILVDPEKSIATVKEEEWETRKKKEITTTRQIETRVKRQVVLEDGEVVVDSGPLVTTNTTEDVEQQEHTTKERRTTGDEPKEVEWPIGGKGEGIVQKELNETVVRSREEIEERLETEDRQQLGDISDEAYLQAIRSNKGDLRIALAESSKQLAPQTGPRVVHHSTRSNKVVDTETTLERSELKANGQIVTEKKKTIEHEEIKDDEVPDGKEGNGDNASETRKESFQRFVKTRDEDIVDYVSGGERIAREMRYVSETTEGERIGDWPPPPSTMRTHRLHKQGSVGEGTPASRKDALTKKPLDMEEEDEARKFETSKWLESHFGSDSRSSHGSLDEDPPIHTGTNTSFINVTMKSCNTRDRDFQNSNSSRPQRRTSGRDSSSPVGYFQGISEWSERHQTTEKNNHVKTSSPDQYINGKSKDNFPSDNTRNHVESYSRTLETKRHQERQDSSEHQRNGAPSPPLRRRVREQKSEEKCSYETTNRTSSPVLVVQRTWESRNKDVQNQKMDREIRRQSPEVKPKTLYVPRSRSISPIPRATSPKKDKKIFEQENTRTSKTSGQSKYKIGESFRKLVGKLRSASSERKNKKSGSSTSQVTQTDDTPTYMQYNSVDKNIPLGPDYDLDDKPPERPPRSPRNNTPVSHNIKTTKMHDYNSKEQWHRNESVPPVQRYYLGEDPFGGSIYGKEKGYENSKPHGRHRTSGKSGIETEYSVESNSLGRFSKSASRLSSEYEREEHFRSTQTLPRKLHTSGHSERRRQISRNHLNESRITKNQVNDSRNGNHSNEFNGIRNGNHLIEIRGGNYLNEIRSGNNHLETRNGNNHLEMRNGNNHFETRNGNHFETRNGNHYEIRNGNESKFGSLLSSKLGNNQRYGSMINIHFKNNVGHAKPVQTLLQGPTKPDRTYKSSLSRSKSFNVEANRNYSDRYSPSTHYKSNSQLNRLDETPPLKSPGILASISRSNRDLKQDF
ncbi:homeobox protein 2 isoform X2 [Leptopilina heterotoma]|uniref:homeobox protein 2 isoform X2 n=1 Tax=Leptopilina heterotoma TaxID=63436 RepID=UPI001CA87F64|nr:homeobox protein 2 isoform X2 [Leptopilina heterotoma]